jgi:GNAT superfamily N-acetyltransferase
MPEVSLPPLDGYCFSSLTADDEPAVQALLARCADYLELVAGLPPSPNLAHELFSQLPAGKGKEDKLLWGISAELGELVGLLDAVRDYPAPEVWFMGLLLLEPTRRGQRVGEQIYDAFEWWARTQGAAEIRLSVAEHNEAAWRFWQRLGFLEMERRPPAMFGGKESRFILMNHMLHASSASC